MILIVIKWHHYINCYIVSLSASFPKWMSSYPALHAINQFITAVTQRNSVSLGRFFMYKRKKKSKRMSEWSVN